MGSYIKMRIESTPSVFKKHLEIVTIFNERMIWYNMANKWIPCSGQADGKSEHCHFRNQWTKMGRNGKFNSDDHYIYYYGKEPLRRNGVAPIVIKRVWNAVLGCNLKDDRVISVRPQGNTFKISVILQQDGEALYLSAKTRTGADCGSDHELLIARFKLKLKKEWPLGHSDMT